MLQQSGNVQYVLKDLRIHDKMLNSCNWNGDGKYLGTCFSDRQVKICQLESSGTVRAIQTIPCSLSVKTLIWNPIDNQRFAIVGADKFIELWDVRAPRATSKISSLHDNVNASWSPDGKYIATTTYSNHLCLFDTRESKSVQKAHFGYELNQVSWTAGSDHILCATEASSRNGEMEVISFKDNKCSLMGTIQAHSATCDKLVVDSSYQRLALGSLDLTVTLWDLDDLICHSTINCEHPVEGMSFSGNGKYLAICLGAPYMLICDSSTAECVAKIDARFHGREVAWHPTENLIALGVEDKGGAPASMRLVSFPNGL